MPLMRAVAALKWTGAVIAVVVAGLLIWKGTQKPAVSEDLSDKVVWARPLWSYLGKCRERDEFERHRDAIALEALQTFDARRGERMATAAVAYFANGGYQRVDQEGKRDGEPACPPVHLDKTVADAALRARVFEGPFLYEDPLRLAERLGPRDPKIVDAVARTAFYASLIPSDALHWDLRPFARMVLAGFGAAARPWSDQAFAMMSAADPMATGAAQIAVGAGHPEALARTRTLMSELLASVPKDRPVPYRTRNRLYDLAYALGMAGLAAEPYSAPLVLLLSRGVESWAPPFGMIDYHPVSMCVVGERIGGRAAEAARVQEFCQRRPLVYEQ